MSQTFDQFVRFTTDAAGLERTFRLFQSIAQILSSYTIPFECLLFLLACLPASALGGAGGAGGAGRNPPDAAVTGAVLVGLRVKFNVARRYFRLFRFLESFGAAQKAYASLSVPSKPNSGSGSASALARRALWIDVFGRTFNGMYLLLEASTFLDVQRVEGLALWSPEMEAVITVEGQRFWLFSLACGVLAGLFRIADVLASAPVPAPTLGEKEGEAKDGDDDGDVDEKSGDGEDGDSSDRKGPKGEQIDYLAWKREARSKVSNLGRRVVSDALDITLPGSIVGWVPASTGTVGLAMFVTTVLTSMDIWERCGREVASGNK
ncbi:hypothetical protein GGR51DRAFT_507393 [Nemania sp. FL0031]|nr:hypothetical protein GGR51DRAFT_507393 [Nemania sp. FL0031]